MPMLIVWKPQVAQQLVRDKFVKMIATLFIAPADRGKRPRKGLQLVLFMAFLSGIWRFGMLLPIPVAERRTPGLFGG